MLNTMIQVLTLMAQIAGSNGNCMVDTVEAGTAVLLCGFVDSAYGWDDSAGVSQGEYPASWLGPEGASLNAAVNVAAAKANALRAELSAGDDGRDLSLDCNAY